MYILLLPSSNFSSCTYYHVTSDPSLCTVTVVTVLLCNISSQQEDEHVHPLLLFLSSNISSCTYYHGVLLGG